MKKYKNNAISSKSRSYIVLICNFNFMSVCKGTIKFQPMYIVYTVRTALFKKLA